MISNPIKISVVLPLFNPRKDHLKECIKSLVEQEYQDFELIVVDDSNKNEDYVEIFKSFSKDKLQYFKNNIPLGLQASLNFAIKNARGEFIARMDGDDISKRKRFATQLKFLEENPKISIVGSNCITIDAKGNNVGVRLYPYKKKNVMRSIFSPLAHPSVMFQKDFFNKFGLYSEEIELEDWELWLRVLKNGGEIYNIQENLLKIRVFSNNEYQRPRHWHLVHKIGIKHFDRERFIFSIIFIIFWFCVYIFPFKNILRKIKNT